MPDAIQKVGLVAWRAATVSTVSQSTSCPGAIPTWGDDSEGASFSCGANDTITFIAGGQFKETSESEACNGKWTVKSARLILSLVQLNDSTVTHQKNSSFSSENTFTATDTEEGVTVLFGRQIAL